MSGLLQATVLILHVWLAATQNPAPVYVNPTAQKAAIQSSITANAGSLLTQTVYGFLDFTTTIGNTVMVFSPQSAPPSGQEKKQSAPENEVIQTKPAASSAPDIQPSRTSDKPAEETSEKQIPEKPPSPIIESSSETKVLSQAPIYSSVEVKVNNPKPEVYSVVEVKAEPQKKHSDVSLSKKGKEDTLKKSSESSSVTGEPETESNKPVILSSIIEVHSAPTEAPAISGNGIGKEFYDFLSKEPGEVVDESFKVIDLKPSTKVNVRVKTRESVEIRTRVNVVTQTDIKTRVSTSHHHPSNDDNFPTGLVTKLGGTIVKDGLTTVHETRVIGTFISGKYAQILQSTSHIYHANSKPRPTPTLKILKTAAPLVGHKHKPSPHLDPTPAGSLLDETVALPLEVLFSSVQELGPSATSKFTFSSLHDGRRDDGLSSTGFRLRPTPSRRSGTRTDFLSRLNRSRLPSSRDEEKEEPEESPKKPTTTRSRSPQTLRPSFRFSGSRYSRTSSPSSSTRELSTVSVFNENQSKAPGRRYQSYRSRTSFRPNNTPGTESSYTRRGYKPRQTSTEQAASHGTTSLYKFKLSRPTGRWQYKTSPKPRVNIRRQYEDTLEDPEDVEPNASASTPQVSTQVNLVQSDQDLEETTSVELPDDDEAQDLQPAQAETIGIDISTPADLQDIYYEIATIKSPYTFQVGTVKNTRFITLTSTIEKTFQAIQPTPTEDQTSTQPLPENILATSAPYDNDNILHPSSSIATLPPIGLAGDAETPPLETFTETFNTTQLMLKTHILPVFKGTDTIHYTLVQSYHITRLVTAIKTLPPMEVYHFIPSRTLKEFNTRLEEAGSENREHLLDSELEFGENDNESEDLPPNAQVAFPRDLDLANVGSDFDVSDVDKRLGPQVLLKSPPTTTTTPKPPPSPPPAEPTPQLSPEQLQQFALLKYLNPLAPLPVPSVITTSKPIVTTETIFESHIIPIWNGLTTSYSTISRPVSTVSKTEYEYGTTQVAGPANPFQSFTLTSTPIVTETVITSTQSKILKLTFGAKTAYTTLYSTTVVPTVLTTYVTTSVPVQPTAAIPGFFPGAFPAFPFLG